MKEINFSDILKITSKYLPEEDSKKLEEAFEFAKKCHKGQKRKSGEDYINHPLNVAYILAKMKMDADTISAALLHDVVEESDVTVNDLKEKFGSTIATLVDGVTKTGDIKYRDKDYSHGPEVQIQNLRKMFLVMAKDVRVVLIRLADRLHNMQTLKALSPEKQLRIAKETLEVYTPLAHRLGMGEMKGNLEDLAFPYVYPKEYKKLKKETGEKYSEREKYIAKVKAYINDLLKKNKIDHTVDGRAKHLYSLYKKLQKYDCDISKIYDLIALRVVVDSIGDCYKTLGLLHDQFKPLNGRIKDYIAIPKPNGYQSLHTTVFCLDGKITEIQIRTKKMHDQAENGIAAHWHYGIKKTSGAAPTEEIAWVKELSRWKMHPKESRDFAESLKIDAFSDRIFAFTPEGEIKNLPEGATPVDFAFEVHSDIGSTCVGAKINGEVASLDKEIKNGDIVEIVSRPNSKPKEDWLKFAKTERARSHIKSYLKEQRTKGLI